jgi:uncharacterized protein YjeT (DUF2065 family)
MVACGDRWKALAGIGAPTPVLPGDPDRMIRAKGRKATSTAIAVARLAILSGVGYGALPRALWPRIIDGISALTAKAGRTASS